MGTIGAQLFRLTTTQQDVEIERPDRTRAPVCQVSLTGLAVSSLTPETTYPGVFQSLHNSQRSNGTGEKSYAFQLQR